jgi:protein-S-isoprenylcysteine O-methyltransferase Ste14
MTFKFIKEVAMASLAPLALLSLFLLVGIGLRSWLQLRRHGTTGLVLFREGPAGHLRDLALLGLPLALFVQAIAQWLAPQWLRAVQLPLREDAVVWSRSAGALLIVTSTLLMFVSQLDLGASWRVGIDRGSRPGLVVNGAYRICRNPIFACMLLALLGFALLQPTYLSVALLAATYLGIRLQVAQEEAYLTETYGAAYRRYAARTGRFFPGLGRLTRP